MILLGQSTGHMVEGEDEGRNMNLEQGVDAGPRC